MDMQFCPKFIIAYFVILYINGCLPIPTTKIYTIESDKVCSLGKKRLHLGKYNKSSILVKETRYFDTWLGDHSFTCKFKVEADRTPEDGVFAVIQNLSMRRDPFTGRCIDYVQFRPSNEELSEKVCGKISIHSTDMKMSDSMLPEPMGGPNSYIATNGRMDVYIYVANQKLEFGEKIDMDIAFTSYKACGKSEEYRSCYDDHDSGLYCIWKGFFYDSIVNCPFPHCPDEGGCQQVRDDIGPSHGSSPAVVTGAAVATLLIVFGSFLACIWLLRKLQLLCWSFPGNVRQTPVVEFSGHGEGDVLPSSAPSYDLVSEPISPDKDLPPKYDDLFPPRQTQ